MKIRLTGAVILVAIFVLFVPELLTGPKSSQATSGATTDDGMRRYTIDLNASSPAAPARPETAAGVQPPVVLPPVAHNSVNDGAALAKPGEQAMPVSSPDVTVPKAPTPSTTALEPVPVGSNQSRAAPTAAAPVTGAPSAVAHAELPRAAPASAAERGTFVVQLGSFGSRENAERLVHDMTAKGFAAFVAPITSGGRELYRVRVGPTRDRTSAEALAAQLRRVGQSGSIVPIT